MNDTSQPNSSNSPTDEGAVPTKRGTVVKVAVFAGILLALFVASRFIDIQGAVDSTFDQIEALGPLGYVIFAVLYVLACVFMMPASPLTLAAGAAYGLGKGFILVSASSTLGALAAFLVGRYAARDWVAGRLEGSTSFKAIDDAVGREGWKIVGMTRLSPAFPFNVQNYAYGLTKVSVRHYVIASWIGMIPGTVMYVYLGTVAGSVATAGSEDAAKTPAEWALLVVGLVATIIVTVMITRIAQKALKDAVGTE